MSGRLADKVAVIVGGGQTPGQTIGNGRATAMLFAREGARVVVVDRDRDRADDTCRAIAEEGGVARAVAADATVEADCQRLVADVVATEGRLDILHNNVGIGGRDSTPSRIDPDAWDEVMGVNLKSVVLPCKAALPVMRRQGGGSIVNVSSIAAVCATPLIAYKTSKAGINAYTQSLAVGNARYMIRANVIMPGLMDTPMAIEFISEARGMDRDDLRAERNAQVPLGGQMGTAWDVAHAALYLASDEARFVTGVVLPVDGGQSARIG